jgi:S-adenosyl-L-methionine hydrolase (adenosine-forming)
MPIITLTTDFGVGSHYVGAMKGAILSINPLVTIVDITHAVPAQDIAAGALVLEDTTRWFPKDTIHVAVIDPGVGTDRSIIYARIGTQQFIAPDNGLLSRLMAATKPSMVTRVTEAQYRLPQVSNTFHGRDIMGPAAAHLSMGVHPRRLGPAVRVLNQFDSPLPQMADAKILGEVMAIDSFGNLITNIVDANLAGKPRDEHVCVVCGLYETVGIHRTYGEQAPGSLLALIGSSGRLELAIVGDNAAKRLGVSVGTPVVVAWE